MKKLLTLLILLLSLPAFAGTHEARITQTYNSTPSKGDTIVVSCSYGDIIVEHWNKPSLEIELDVRVWNKSEKKAQQIAGAIGFEPIKSNRRSGGRTSFNNSKKQILNGNHGERWEITMRVKMPKGHPAHLTTTFGSIDGDDFDAPLTVKSSYGKVKVGALRNASLTLQFCSDSEVASAKNIALDNRYSTINIGRADTLRASDQFGKIKIGQLNAAGLGLAYSEFVSTDIVRSLRANAKFSKIKIARLASDFRLVEVDGSYSNLNIGISSKARFNVTTQRMKYGKCKIKGLRTRVISPEDDEMDYDSSRRGSSDRQELSINGGGSGKILFDGGNFSDLTITAGGSADIEP